MKKDIFSFLRQDYAMPTGTNLEGVKQKRKR
jgi:hypothetical protein